MNKAIEINSVLKHTGSVPAVQNDPNSNDTPAQMQIPVSDTREIIQGGFPHLWPAVEAGLATCATLLLKDNANPVALIYVGPASAGKTTIANMFEGATVKGEVLCYRSDNFTAASFVSHSAKATKKDLKDIDLLPRIKHKVLLTPELATIFRGKQDDLAVRFSLITRVLDGQGLTTDSGTHGKRGYTGDFLFAWIGCTTPFGSSVWKAMAQLGSRLFFLVMDAVAEPTVDDLVQSINQSVPYQENVKACGAAVRSFLDSLFTRRGGVRGVEWKGENNTPEVIEGIARCASLLAVMRTPDDSGEGKPPQHESSHRANSVLYNLARGRALVHGRTDLSTDDLPSIAQVTLSSIPAERRAVLVGMAGNEGNPLSVRQVEEATGRSRHTCETIMAELDWLGIMKSEREGKGRPSLLTIRPDWNWVVTGDFAALLLKGATWQKSGDVCVPGSIEASLEPDSEENVVGTVDSTHTP